MYFDLFFKNEPTTEEGNDKDQFYAVAIVNTGNSVYYHVQLTQEQYLYHTSLDSKLVKETTKLATKIFKSIKKSNSYDEATPYHVFGDSVICLDKNIKYNVDSPNESISSEDKEKMLKVKEVKDGIEESKV